MTTIHKTQKRIDSTTTVLSGTHVEGRTITVEATSNDGSAVCITKTFHYDNGAVEQAQIVLRATDVHAIAAALRGMPR